MRVVGSSKKATSPTAEFTMRISPTSFSKTIKRLSWGLRTVTANDDGRWRMLWRGPRVCVGGDVGRMAAVASETLRERLSWRLW